MAGGGPGDGERIGKVDQGSSGSSEGGGASASRHAMATMRGAIRYSHILRRSSGGSLGKSGKTPPCAWNPAWLRACASALSRPSLITRNFREKRGVFGLV